MVTFDFGRPESVPTASTRFTTSIPSTTSPKTTCLPSSHDVTTVVMKNCVTRQLLRAHPTKPGKEKQRLTCEPLVFGPAFAMERRPGLSCRRLKFSSAWAASILSPKVAMWVILTSKLVAIDRLATGAIVTCEITALEHELGCPAESKDVSEGQ